MIPRPRLDRRLAASSVSLIEAPGGYGKSTAAAQLAISLDVTVIRAQLAEEVGTGALVATLAAAVRRAGVPTITAAFDADDPAGALEALVERLAGVERPVLIIIDDVQRADAEAAHWLAQLALGLPTGMRLVIAGRRLGPELAALASELGTPIVGIDALRFDADEVAAVLASGWARSPTPKDIAEVHARTDGWPAAVSLLAARHRAPTDRLVGTDGAAVLQSMMDDLVAAASPATQELLGSLVELRLLSAPVLAVVGGYGALDRLLDAGLPIRFRADGWRELPDPIRDALLPRPLPIAVRRDIAARYARRGELAEAMGLLLRAGDHDGVVELLTTQSRDRLRAGGLELVEAVLDQLQDEVIAAAPTLLVELVRAAERRTRLRSTLIERAVRILPDASPEQRAMAVEAALDVARAGDLEAGIAGVDGVLAAAAPAEVATRGRAHHVRALCRLVMDTAGNIRDVADELERAIGLLNAAGERDWLAEAHQVLGYGCYMTLGALEPAADHLGKALALRPAPDAARAGTLTFVSQVLSQQARFEEAAVAIREATTIGRRLGDDRTIAYAAWSAADLACQRRDGVAMGLALEEVVAHPGGWFDQFAGTEFLAHAAEMHAALGGEVAARTILARAMERADGSALPDAALGAQVRVEVTFGDPMRALPLLDALEADSATAHRDRWLALLYRAVCQARMGDSAGARDLLDRSRRAASEAGDPDRADRREPELVAIVTPTSVVEPPVQGIAVILLGRFAVERNGVDASPPPGRPSTLVKMLALGGTLTVDLVIDELWPDADIEVGRARLRNLLNRIRVACGDLIIRHDSALELASGAIVDAHRFERAASAALAAPRDARIGLGRAALAWSAGELLPTDRYADWASIPRERIRRRQLALLDLVAQDAITRGDLDEAGRILDIAITTDPMEEERYVRLARAFLAQGRSRRARRVVDQALAICADLAVEPGEELEVLLAELARQA
ncbi:MAG: hypothetical protein LH650_08710 [Chloroflexi bacterium]|nr:hypothetical protein [Chloroflexota bacterium]